MALPDWLLTSADAAKQILLAAAMFGLGTGVVIKQLMKQGLPAMVVGAIATIVIIVLAFIAVKIASV